jgi:hypothetical protein
MNVFRPLPRPQPFRVLPKPCSPQVGEDQQPTSGAGMSATGPGTQGPTMHHASQGHADVHPRRWGWICPTCRAAGQSTLQPYPFVPLPLFGLLQWRRSWNFGRSRRPERPSAGSSAHGVEVRTMNTSAATQLRSGPGGGPRLGAAGGGGSSGRMRCHSSLGKSRSTRLVIPGASQDRPQPSSADRPLRNAPLSGACRRGPWSRESGLILRPSWWLSPPRRAKFVLSALP